MFALNAKRKAEELDGNPEGEDSDPDSSESDPGSSDDEEEENEEEVNKNKRRKLEQAKLPSKEGKDAKEDGTELVTVEMSDVRRLNVLTKGLVQTAEASREIVTCAVCLDIFHNPVTLECSHTFCNHCVHELLDLVCPICRADITEYAHKSIAMTQMVQALGFKRENAPVIDAKKVFVPLWKPFRPALKDCDDVPPNLSHRYSCTKERTNEQVRAMINQFRLESSKFSCTAWRSDTGSCYFNPLKIDMELACDDDWRTAFKNYLSELADTAKDVLENKRVLLCIPSSSAVAILPLWVPKVSYVPLSMTKERNEMLDKAREIVRVASPAISVISGHVAFGGLLCGPNLADSTLYTNVVDCVL